ncbi:MAG: hypothetical protein ACR2GY_14580 [Phycisphaerales bacterium]
MMYPSASGAGGGCGVAVAAFLRRDGLERFFLVGCWAATSGESTAVSLADPVFFFGEIFFVVLVVLVLDFFAVVFFLPVFFDVFLLVFFALAAVFFLEVRLFLFAVDFLAVDFLLAAFLLDDAFAVVFFFFEEERLVVPLEVDFFFLVVVDFDRAAEDVFLAAVVFFRAVEVFLATIQTPDKAFMCITPCL